MKKRAFENFINTLIDIGKKEKIIYDNGLDLIDFVDNYSKVNSILMGSIYGDDVTDLIFDFIYHNVYDDLEKNKEIFIITTLDKETGNDKILADCSTLDGLYEYSEQVRLELIKSNFNYDIKEPMSEEERDNLFKQIFKING